MAERVWVNNSRSCKLGRDPTYGPMPEEMERKKRDGFVVPLNIGPSKFLGPGDKLFESDGSGMLILQGGDNRFVECGNIKEIIALKVPPQRVVYDEDVPPEEADRYHEKLTPIGFFGAHRVLKEITVEFVAAIGKAGDRVASVQTLAELQDTTVKALDAQKMAEQRARNLEAELAALREQMKKAKG